MRPIDADSGLAAGDVVHHPAFGFAAVDAVDARGVQLRWRAQGANHPRHVSRHALQTSYFRCESGGLIARAVHDPAGLRELAGTDPVAALGELLREFGEPQPVVEVRDWLARLLPGEGFEGWWAALLGVAASDPRFLVSGDRVGLAPGVQAIDFSPGAASEPGPAPAVPPPASDPWSVVEDMAAGLVPLHALRRSPDLAANWPERLVPGVSFHPEDDVRLLCRTALERVVGPLPNDLPDDDAIEISPALAAGLDPEWLAVMRDGLAADPALRPRDAAALVARLAVARAIRDVRDALPASPDTPLCAGFDTHIGAMKSLSGQTNQDAFLLVGEPSSALAVIADGISTANAGTGDLASLLTVRTLRLWWSSQTDRAASDADARRRLGEALARANTVVCEAAERIAGGSVASVIPMGTTVVAAVTAGNRVHLAALGDSRAFLVGRFGVASLVPPQNLNAARLRGEAPVEGTGWEGAGFALTGYVGHFDLHGRPSPAPPFYRSVSLLPDEWLILCTDGFTDFAARDEASVARRVEESVHALKGAVGAAAAMQLARAMVNLANDGGGGDNVTVLTLTISPPAPAEAGGTPVPSEDDA
jgi:protein phosphatase